MSEQIIQISDQVQLWCKTGGDRKNPPILFIEGAGASGFNLWTEILCQTLNKNYYTIRFDPRDVGRSTYFDFNKDPYTLSDMMQDVLDLLQSLHLTKVHIIGSSVGGYIAQLLAIHHPNLVLSLTILASTNDFSPAIKVITGETSRETTLPPPEPAVIEMLSACLNSITDTDILENQLHYGDLPKEDEEKYSLLLQEIKKHPKNPKADQHHLKAIRDMDPSLLLITEQLRQLRVPALVIQGSDDPLFKIAHGQSIAKAIPNARLHIIKNMGHMIFPAFLAEITGEIMGFLKNI